MNLVLIGYRGAGKSVVAAILSRKLGMPAVSLDAEIVREAGMSIPEIVEKRGWSWFRDLESAVTQRFAESDGLILDTGGGVILRPENTENLRRGGVVFWLEASVEVIVERIRASNERPSLTQGKSFVQEVAEVLEERLPLYRAAADRAIATDSLGPAAVADEIIREFRALSAEGRPRA